MSTSPSKLRWRGHYACTCLIDLMADYETKWYKGRVATWQGSYNGGSLSAGTHLGGGAWDGAPYSDRSLVQMRRRGGVASRRTRAQGFQTHCHMIVAGCPHASWAAKYQVSEYRAGRNGLAGRGRDDGPGGHRQVTWKSYKASLTKPRLIARPGSHAWASKIRAVSVTVINRARQSGKRSESVWYMQAWLRTCGYYRSPVDGVYGKATEAAVYNFRRKHLRWSEADSRGDVGPKSLAALRARAMKLARVTTKPLAK